MTKHPTMKELPPDQTPPLSSRNCSGTETVLVADDEELLREFNELMLRKNGYHVLTAGDGEEALRLCQHYRQPIHLLLTDVVMPNMSGPQLAREILLLYPDLPVLFTSGCTEDVMSLYGMQGAESEFLPKPYTAEDLLRKVRQVLQGGRNSAR